jgi:alpha-ketoglutarate-dependent taurine dioxygenase
VLRHPRSGEWSWFNQAQHWHASCLDEETRELLREVLRDQELPRTCYYGDGSQIEDSVMQEILGAYAELELVFPWQPGDVAVLDNVLVAHGRNPYRGKRRLLVAIGDMRRSREERG